MIFVFYNQVMRYGIVNIVLHASIFPFSSVDDSELYNLMNCRIPSHLELILPSLDVLSKISAVPYLDNSDIIITYRTL